MRTFRNRWLPALLVCGATICCSASAAWAQAVKEEDFKVADGTKIHYYLSGDKGSWVVLLHGQGDSANRMWFTTGIAPALAKTHRVVAIDARNHGKSDKDSTGTGNPQDVVEVMDHLKIDKAHIHGYSMGGGLTGRLLGSHPQRFITAAFGGSGLNETDPDLAAKARAKDAELIAKAPPEALRQNRGGRGARGARGGAQGAATPPAGGSAPAAANAAAGAATTLPAAAAAQGAAPPAQTAAGAGRGRGGAPRTPVDLSKLDIPIITINGEYDNPNSKSSRPAREAKVYKDVILPGKNHLTAIAVGGPMPQQYIDELVAFINSHDAK